MARDYPSQHLINRLGITDQQWPEYLEMSEGESLDAYRHRLSQQFYVPTVLAGLNELKGRYVEIMNPLLSRAVIRASRRLDDAQRRYARAYVDVALATCWPIPVARSSAVAPAEEYLSRPGAVMAMARELGSPQAELLLGPRADIQLLDALEAHLAAPVGRGARAKRLLKVVLPTRAAIRLTPPYTGPPPLTALTLAFRAYIASRMARILSEDATALRVGGP